MPGGVRDAIALGPPSALTTWAFDLLREACAVAPGRPAIRFVDRGDLIEPVGGGRGRLLYLSNYPSPSLLAECRDGGGPLLLLLDDPFDSVRYLQQLSKGGVVEALRFQTAAVASYPQLRGRADTLLVSRVGPVTAGEIVDRILAHFGLDLSPDARGRLLRVRLGPKGEDADLESALAACVGGHVGLDEARRGFTDKDAAMIGGVLAPMIQMSFSDDEAPIIWPTAAFLSGNRPDSPAELVEELTGGARILYYGPYFHLPAGLWKARMTVGFSAGARRVPLSVEVYNGTRLLALAIMAAHQEGIYHASFEFNLDDALQPIEIRIRSDRGAIEGRLALGKIELIPAAASRPAAVY